MTDPNRADRVGLDAPWPLGKPRSDPTAWLAIQPDVQELLVEPDTEGCSRAEIARRCEVNPRTVTKWVDGLHVPSPSHVKTIKRWLRAMTARHTKVYKG